MIGSIIGEPYKFTGNRYDEFEFIPDKPKFTDNTVLTVATAHAILESNLDFAGSYAKFAKRYPL